MTINVNYSTPLTSIIILPDEVFISHKGPEVFGTSSFPLEAWVLNVFGVNKLPFTEPDDVLISNV